MLLITLASLQAVAFWPRNENEPEGQKKKIPWEGEFTLRSGP
jgi:hypothetical protein